MAEITGFTASRMKQIENETVVNGYLNGNNELVLVLRNGVEINTGSVIDPDTITGASIIGDNLIMSQRDGDTINLGNVRGPQGIQGVPGNDGTDGVDGVTDHGLLTGLGDNDHPQYQIASTAAKIATGTYVGDSVDGRIISLPFTPFIVMITNNQTGASGHFSIGAFTTAGTVGWQSGGSTLYRVDPANSPDSRGGARPVTNGFQLNGGQTGSDRNNYLNTTYTYLAFKG